MIRLCLSHTYATTHLTTSDRGPPLSLGTLPPPQLLPPLPPISSGLPPSCTSTATTFSTACTTSAALDPTTTLLNLLIPRTEKAQTQSKVWIGDGLPAIAKKLHSSILNWEFIDLAELKPPSATEAVGSDPDTQKLIITPSLEVSRCKRKPIRDISTWAQCFAVYTTVLATKDSSIITELMAYMVSIIRAAQEYEEPAWQFYDRAFREKAAATGFKKWSQLDPVLYNRFFTGKAKHIRFHCAQSGHLPESCSLLRKRPSGDNSGQLSTFIPAKAPKFQQHSDSTICGLFNRGNCTFKVCKFRHICSVPGCEGRHPAVTCPKCQQAKLHK